MNLTSGLAVKRSRTCEGCGGRFETRSASARWCPACKDRHRYGRTYDGTAPRQFGVYRPGGVP